MIVEERYKYLGARGLRWTDWFKVHECDNVQEALKFISEKDNPGDGREIEFRYY